MLPGNVGGALRIGSTVHRSTGPWTPAVHALLDHHATRVPHVPRVHGFDEQGREILDFLPGLVVDIHTEEPTGAQLVALVEWVRGLHRAVADLTHPGPWRFFDVPAGTLVGHNDLGWRSSGEVGGRCGTSAPGSHHSAAAGSATTTFSRADCRAASSTSMTATASSASTGGAAPVSSASRTPV